MSEPWFAVRHAYTAPPVLGQDKAAREVVKHVVVQAVSAEAAARFAVDRSSVYAVAHGLSVDVVEIDWSDPSGRFHASYDGPAMDDHMATGAKLVFREAANSQARPE